MRMRAWLAVLCATAAIGCEGAEDDGDDAVSGKSLGAAGGFVTSDDGVFTVIFPPGALAEATVITVRIASDAPASLGNPYSVQGASTVAMPIVLEYRYALAQVEGKDLAQLNLGTSAIDRWDPLSRLAHNEHTQTVSATDPMVGIAYGLMLGGVDIDMGTSGSGGDDATDANATATEDPPDSATDPTESSGPTGTTTAGETDAPGGCGNGIAEPDELCLEPADPLLGGGLGPVAIEAVDLDDDGSDDLVVAHAGTLDVSVRLGDGDGGFARETLYAVSAAPADVAVGDFDDAAGPDIATVGGNLVGLLLGQGDGTFADEVPFSVANASAAAAVGNVDEAGGPDLLVAHSGGGLLGVLLGDAAGLAEELTFPSGAGPLDLVTGDFNGDANVDVATADSTGVSVMNGNGAAAFGDAFTTPLTGTAVAIAAADFNGDGFLDLAAIDADGGRVVLLFGNGVGGFAGGTPYAVGLDPAAIVSADFDSDGNADLAVSGAGDDSVTVLRGRANGSFADADTFVVGPGPTALAAGDLNGDTAPDLAIAHAGDDTIGLLLSVP